MDEFEVEIKQLIKPLSFKAKALFAAITSERLYQNYVLFQERTGWGNSLLLQDAIALIFQYIINNNLISVEEVEYFKTRIDLITPDTEDFEGTLTSWALDACTTLINTLNFFISKDDQEIFWVASTSLDTVDFFLYEKEQIDTLDESGKKQAEHDEFMVREKQRQRDLIAKLSKLDLTIITDELIDSLRVAYPIIDLSLFTE